MFTIKKLVAQVGSRSIAYDVRQKPDWLDWKEIVYMAKDANLTLYDGGAEGVEETRAASRHLTPVDWSLTDTVTQMVNLAAFIKAEFDALSGVNGTMKGQLGDRQGNDVSQLALQQGDLIQRYGFYLHQRLEADALTAMCNIGKYIWASNPGHRVLISQKFARKVINVTKDISMESIGIIIRDGYERKKEEEFVMGLAERMSSTGAISLGDLLNLWKNKGNIARLQTLIKDGLSAKERADALLAQQSNQIAADANALKKRELDLQEAKIKIDSADKRYVADRNAGSKTDVANAQIENQQQMADVQNANDLQKLGAEHYYQTSMGESAVQ